MPTEGQSVITNTSQFGVRSDGTFALYKAAGACSECCDSGDCGECTDSLPLTVTLDLGTLGFSDSVTGCSSGCAGITGQYIQNRYPPANSCGYFYTEDICSVGTYYTGDHQVYSMRIDSYIRWGRINFVGDTGWYWTTVFHFTVYIAALSAAFTTARAWYDVLTSTTCTGKTYSLNYNNSIYDSNTPCLFHDENDLFGQGNWPDTIDLIVP